MVGLVIGAALFFIGIFAAHFTGLPEANNVGQEIYPHIPRCAFWESQPSCWVIPIASKSLAFLGSQIALGAYVFGWLWQRPLTWAGATISAFLFTLELIILLGIVPNEFLGLTQGTLAWTDQKILVSIPPWLMLNNEVNISYAAVKDIIVAGYSTTVLIAVAVGAYQLQERIKNPKPKPQVVSTYGRPVVKGER